MKIKCLMVLFSFVLICSIQAHNREKEMEIQLPDSSAFRSGEIIVVLLESSEFKVFTFNETFTDELKDQSVKSNPAKKLYNIYKNRTFDESYYSDSILTDINQREMLKFIKASLMSGGKCFVLNKSTYLLEKILTLEFYTTQYSIGRKFLLNGNLILEITDGIQ